MSKVEVELVELPSLAVNCKSPVCCSLESMEKRAVN